jgi:hypothetical protein
MYKIFFGVVDVTQNNVKYYLLCNANNGILPPKTNITEISNTPKSCIIAQGLLFNNFSLAALEICYLRYYM